MTLDRDKEGKKAKEQRGKQSRAVTPRKSAGRTKEIEQTNRNNHHCRKKSGRNKNRRKTVLRATNDKENNDFDQTIFGPRTTETTAVGNRTEDHESICNRAENQGKRTLSNHRLQRKQRLRSDSLRTTDNKGNSDFNRTAFGPRTTDHGQQKKNELRTANHREATIIETRSSAQTEGNGVNFSMWVSVMPQTHVRKQNVLDGQGPVRLGLVLQVDPADQT